MSSQWEAPWFPSANWISQPSTFYASLLKVVLNITFLGISNLGSKAICLRESRPRVPPFLRWKVGRPQNPPSPWAGRCVFMINFPARRASFSVWCAVLPEMRALWISWVCVVASSSPTWLRSSTSFYVAVRASISATSLNMCDSSQFIWCSSATSVLDVNICEGYRNPLHLTS